MASIRPLARRSNVPGFGMKKGFLSSPAPKKSPKKKKKTGSTNVVENAVALIEGVSRGHIGAGVEEKMRHAWLFLLQRTEDEVEARELIHKKVLELLSERLSDDDADVVLVCLQIFNSLTKHISLVPKLDFALFLQKAQNMLQDEIERVTGIRKSKTAISTLPPKKTLARNCLWPRCAP